MAVWNTGGSRFMTVAVALASAVATGCVEKRSPFEASGDAGTTPPAASSVHATKLGDVGEACNAICERSRVLRCQGADECIPNCVGAASGTPCNMEFRTFYQCLVPQPIKNWECAEDGVAAIKPGFCEKEQEVALRCMETKAKL